MTMGSMPIRHALNRWAAATLDGLLALLGVGLVDAPPEAGGPPAQHRNPFAPARSGDGY